VARPASAHHPIRPHHDPPDSLWSDGRPFLGRGVPAVDDLIEDADGYLIARAVKQGKSIVEAVRDHYNVGGALIMLDGALLPSVLQNLPGGADKLSGFEQGFVDALLARMGMETRQAAQLKANQRRYLQEAAERALDK
jgi:hypothetical protein